MPSILKPKDVAGSIMAKRKPTGGLDFESDQDSASQDEMGSDEQSEASQDDGLGSAAHDLMTAIHANDPDGVAAAFKSAFQILESAPHDETDHSEDNQQPTEDEGQQ